MENRIFVSKKRRIRHKTIKSLVLKHIPRSLFAKNPFAMNDYYLLTAKIVPKNHYGFRHAPAKVILKVYPTNAIKVVLPNGTAGHFVRSMRQI